MNLKRKIIIILVVFFVAVIYFKNVSAETYFYYDAENEIVDNILPFGNEDPVNFCQTGCSGSGEKGTIQSLNGAPQGENYFQWETVDSQTDHYTQITSQVMPLSNPGYPVSLVLGRKYYLAYYMRFDRLNNLDIWHEGTGMQSADKGVEIYGDGLRVILSRGQWDKCDGAYSPGFSANQDHKFTVWSGNWGTNIDQLTYFSESGYSCTNPPQLDYETWYSVVMAVEIACDETGSIEVWLNGQKIIEQLDVQTVTSCFPTLARIQMGGTIAQRDYDAPAHLRKFDALILSDDWNEIISYINFPNEITPPSAPTGLGVL